MIHIWMSENNYVKSVLFFHPTFTGELRLGHQACAASYST